MLAICSLNRVFDSIVHCLICLSGVGAFGGVPNLQFRVHGSFDREVVAVIIEIRYGHGF